MPGSNYPDRDSVTRLLRAVHLLTGLALEPTVPDVRFADAPDLLAQAILTLDERHLLGWRALFAPEPIEKPERLRWPA